MNKAYLWGSILASAVVACSTSNSTNTRGPSGASCPTGSTLTYDNFGKLFMANYCVECHTSSLSGSARRGAPSDHNFDTLEAIRATEAAHIDTSAAAGPRHANTAMPPTEPRPSLAERQKLGEWLACGTP